MKVLLWLRSIWQWGALLALTASTLFYAWIWSPAPQWTVSDPVMLRWIVGMTHDGRLISLERDRNRNSSVAVYEISTGHLLKRHELHAECSWNGVILADEKHVALAIHRESIEETPVIVNLDDGSLSENLAAVLIENGNGIRISPDGKLLHALAADQFGDVIYEIATGRSLPAKRDVVFSPDSRLWAELDTQFEEPTSLDVRSTVDGGLIAHRQIQVGSKAKLHSWVGDQIRISHNDGGNTQICQVSLRNREIGALTQLPDHYGARHFKYALYFNYHNIEYLHAGTWAGKREAIADVPAYAGPWNKFIAALRLPRNWRINIGIDGEGPRFKSTWQVLDPISGKPLSRPIQIEGEVLRVSPDGGWLVTVGDTMRCWSIPPRSPWPIASLFAAIPWGLFFCRRYWRRAPASSNV